MVVGPNREKKMVSIQLKQAPSKSKLNVYTSGLCGVLGANVEVGEVPKLPSASLPLLCGGAVAPAGVPDLQANNNRHLFWIYNVFYINGNSFLGYKLPWGGASGG